MLILTGCESIFGEDPDFSVYTNAPVNHGEMLELGFMETHGDYDYEIITPDGEVYSRHELMLYDANFTHAGEYELRAVGRRTSSQKIRVEVVPEDFDCSLTENAFRGLPGYVNFVRFDTIIDFEFDGGYRVFGNGNGVNLYLDFQSAERPRGDRTYETVWSTLSSELSVRVVLVNSSNTFYGMGDQPLHTREIDGKTHIYVCDFDFGWGDGDLHVVLD